MKLAIVGSRKFTNLDISKFINEKVREVITGGAIGIDTLAERYADKNKLSKSIPEYDKYGKSAPIIRNKEIVKRADKIIAIWDGKSKGTKFTIEYAKKVGKEVKIYIVECY